MPDSQSSQIWGPAFDERDLDSVLSGETAGIPGVLRPVASTLAALRSAPSPGELAAERSARAAFRAAFPAGPPVAGNQDPPAWHGTVPGHTLILPSAGHSPRRAARHRRARSSRPASRRRPAMLLGGAAVAVMAVLAIGLTGLIRIPVTLTSLGNTSAGASASAKAQGGGKPSGSQGVDGTGSAGQPSVRPSVRPAPGRTPVGTPVNTPVSSATPSTGPATLCRDYFKYFLGPEPPSAWAAERKLRQRLSELAGPHQSILAFCLPYLDSRPAAGFPWPSRAASPSGPGSGQHGGHWKPGGRGPWNWATRPASAQPTASPAASASPAAATPAPTPAAGQPPA